MISSSGRPAARLDIGDAIHDGWEAFSRSPWPFVGFALLVTLLQILCQPLQSRIGNGNELSTNPLDWALYLIGMAASIAINLWGAVGLVRGSWSALQGGHPRLGEMMRWDGAQIGRVLKGWLLLVAVIAVPLVAIMVVLGLPLAFLSGLTEATAPLPQAGLQLLALLLAVLLLVLLGVLLVATIYLSINQKLLVQIALQEAPSGPVALVQRGRRLIDPHWPLMLLLSIVEGLLLLLGILACFVGFFVAWPVVICISTAAYRQLLGGNAEPAEATV